MSCHANSPKLLPHAAAIVLVLLATMATAPARESGSPIPIQVDNRGLLLIDGVLRGDNEATWGATNLVIKPISAFAAQDYCLSNIVAVPGRVTADFATSPAIRMVETTTEHKDAKGRRSLRVAYDLTPANGGQATYERVYIFMPLAVKDVAGGKATFADGKSIPLPLQFGGEEILAQPKEASIVLTWGNKRLLVRSEKLKLTLRDMRPKVTAFQIWLEYLEPKDVKSMQFDFEIAAETTR